MQWIVDGMNVIGSRPDGWWRDRPGARRRLVAELASLVVDGEPLTVVFDGRARSGEVADAAARGVVAEFAPGGPNAADDAIVAMVAAHKGAAGYRVVTSDAELRRRLEAAGATVVGVSAFLRLLRPPGSVG